MVVWASILQSTANTRHLYRFTKEIHQKKAKTMLFRYSKDIRNLDFILAPYSSYKSPSPNFMIRPGNKHVKNKKYMRLRVSTPTPQTNYRQSHSQVSPHLTHHNTSSLLSLSCITIAESTTEGVVYLECSIALLLVRGK